MNLSEPETWKPIHGWGWLYHVSSMGRVKSLPRWSKRVKRDGEVTYYKKERMLRCSPKKTTRGYAVVQLVDRPRAEWNTVHRLVAEAFVPNPENKPCVNHLDGNKSNNRASNLEWCTVAENNHHSRAVLGNTGRLKKTPCGERSNFSKLKESQVLEIRRLSRLMSHRVVAATFGINRSTVSLIHRGSTWKHLTDPTYQHT